MPGGYEAGCQLSRCCSAGGLSFAVKCLAPVHAGLRCQAACIRTQIAFNGCLVWHAHPSTHNCHSSCSLNSLCERLPCWLLLMAVDRGDGRSLVAPASAWRSCVLLTCWGLHVQAFSTSPKKAQKAMLQSQLCSNARVLEDVAERERKAVAYAAESLRHKVNRSCDKSLRL